MTTPDEQLKKTSTSETDFSEVEQPGFIRGSVARKALHDYMADSFKILKENGDSLKEIYRQAIEQMEAYHRGVFFKAFNIAVSVWIGSVIAAVAITYLAMK